MRKLDTPVPVNTSMGVIMATHIAHNFAYTESEVPVINSSILYAILVEGKLKIINELSSCSIIGDDLADLNPNFDNIAAKHQEIVNRKLEGEATLMLAKKADLERQLEELNTQLKS